MSTGVGGEEENVKMIGTIIIIKNHAALGDGHFNIRIPLIRPLQISAYCPVSFYVNKKIFDV